MKNHQKSQGCFLIGVTGKGFSTNGEAIELTTPQGDVTQEGKLFSFSPITTVGKH